MKLWNVKNVDAELFMIFVVCVLGVTWKAKKRMTTEQNGYDANFEI